MTLQELNLNYVYKADKRFDTWQEMQPNADGKYMGDCEDYAITLKKRIPEFKNWDYYYCKLNGIGHCILSNGVLIIDCNSKATILKDKFMERYKIKNLKKYNKLQVLCKIVFSYFYVNFKKN